MQIAETRVTRPKIVDADLDARALDLLEHRDRRIGVFHDRAFRQFEFQARRVDAGFGEHRLDLIDQAWMGEMFAR